MSKRFAIILAVLLSFVALAFVLPTQAQDAISAETSHSPTAPSIDLSVTVSNFAGNCAVTDHYGIEPSETETVYFCYRAVNNGDTTLTRHIVSDDVGGLLFDFNHTLVPAATVFFTRSISVADDLLLTATWEAQNPSTGAQASDRDSAEIIVDAEQLTCNGGPVEFESTLHPSWNNVNIPESPVYWFTSQYPTACKATNPANAAGGRGYAACADADLHNSDPESYAAKLRTTVDVSSYSNAILKFRWRHRKNSNSLFRVSARPQNGSFQTILLNTTGNPSGSFGDQFSIDLSPLMAGDTLEILFTYQGNSHDWYSHVDAVELTCANTPLAVAMVHSDSLQSMSLTLPLLLIAIGLTTAAIRSRKTS